MKENRLSEPSVAKEKDYNACMARDTRIRVCGPDGTLVGFVMVHLENRNLGDPFVAPSAKAGDMAGQCTR